MSVSGFAASYYVATSGSDSNVTAAVHGIFDQWFATNPGEVASQDQLTNEALALFTDLNSAGIGDD